MLMTIAVKEKGRTRGMERFNYPVSVEFTVENFAQILRQQGENLVLKGIAECGVNVDKDELVRALDITRRAVYCQECKYYEPLRGVCERSSADPYEQEIMDTDDFCSNGERREEDDE